MDSNQTCRCLNTEAASRLWTQTVRRVAKAAPEVLVVDASGVEYCDGAGTALPVLVFAVLIVVGTRAVGQAFNRITQFEFWARRITVSLFIAIGIYYCLTFIFRVL